MAEFDIRWFSGLKERELRQEGLIIAEGRLVAERTAAFCDALGILCVPAAVKDAEAISGGAVPIRVLNEAEISRITGYPFHRGLLLAARRPEVPSLSDSAALINSGQRLIILPHITEPENLGAIVRTAAALGWDGIVLGSRSADPFSRRVLRCSMAAVFSISLMSFESDADLALLSSQGWELWAAMFTPSAEPPEVLRRDSPLALILGNERFGIPQDVQARGSGLVAIPQGRCEADGVDSLNVAAAAAILLWEGRPR